jgi:hypothetical protein
MTQNLNDVNDCYSGRILKFPKLFSAGHGRKRRNCMYRVIEADKVTNQGKFQQQVITADLQLPNPAKECYVTKWRNM